MKKVLIIKGFIAALIIAVLGQLTSCQNEDGFTQESTEKVNLIDYDVTKVPCEETEEEQFLRKKAYEVIDKHVSIKNGLFVLDVTNGESIGLSERVFIYYKNRMQESNALLSAQGIVKNQIGEKTIEIYNASNFVGERASGGVTKLVLNWASFELYISNSDCKKIALGSEITAVLSAAIPDPSISKIATIVAGLCGIAFNQFADNYPNGIIFSCEIIPVPIIGCYNDWSFKGQ